MADYLIQRGDTLGKIAKANDTTVEELARLNGIQNVNKIRAGATLVIPGSAGGVDVGDPADGVTLAAGATPDAYTPGQSVAAKQPAASDILALMQGIQYPTYSAPDLSQSYAAAGQQYTSALEAAYQAQKAQLEKQAADLAKQYEALRGQEYVNQRLSAIGNNERLAAMGLAGSLYQNPVSGTSETSRIRQDVALRTNLSNLSLQEQAQVDAIAAEIIQAGYTRDIETAKYMAELSIQQAQAQAEQAALQYQAQQGAYSAQMSMYGTLLDNWYNQQNLAMQQAQNELTIKQGELDYNLGMLQYNQALKGGSSSGSRKSTKLSSDGTELARKLIFSIDPSTPAALVGDTINALRDTLGNYSGEYTQDAINEADHLLYESAVEEQTSYVNSRLKQ